MTAQVFKREKVAHLFAHKAQQSARVASGNFFFNGPTLYSYGTHFVCAHHMPDAYRRDGSALILVNDGRYSMTTGRHMDALRHALPGYLARIRVPELRDSLVRDIARHGAMGVAHELIARFIECTKEAATARRVRPATRAASMATAAVYLADARHLLRCDALRRDLDADERKRAHATLRALPLSVPDMPDDKSAADVARDFASLAARPAYREDVRRALSAFNTAAGNLDAYRAHGPNPEAWRGMANAADALRASGDAARALQAAEHAAKLARVRIPADVRKRAAEIAAHVPALHILDAQEKRAGSVAKFAALTNSARELIATEPGTWRATAALNETRNAAAACAALDTDAEREARAATLADLVRMSEAAANASAPERARALLDVAARNLDAGRLSDARRNVSQAAAIAKDAPVVMQDTVQACNAMDAAIERAQAARAAEVERLWRLGMSDNAPAYDETAGALLRVRGDVIETSQGADVPASVAPMVWQAVNAARDARAAHDFGDDAPRLGHFRLNSIADNGDITAGCHVIRYAELQRVAIVLGFIA